jgi:hypothetical protein
VPGCWTSLGAEVTQNVGPGRVSCRARSGAGLEGWEMGKTVGATSHDLIGPGPTATSRSIAWVRVHNPTRRGIPSATHTLPSRVTSSTSRGPERPCRTAAAATESASGELYRTSASSPNMPTAPCAGFRAVRLCGALHLDLSGASSTPTEREPNPSGYHGPVLREGGQPAGQPLPAALGNRGGVGIRLLVRVPGRVGVGGDGGSRVGCRAR